MQNSAENSSNSMGAHPHAPQLSQGQWPPPNPLVGDIWIDMFDTTHVWQGYYWVKAASPTMALGNTPQCQYIGILNEHKVFHGAIPPPHGEDVYWVTDPINLYDLEAYESVYKSVNGKPTAVWEKLYENTSLLSQLRGFVAGSLLKDFPDVPVKETEELKQVECSREEAEEKLEAFDKIIEPTGRLDVEATVNGLLDQLKTSSTYKTLNVKMLEDFIKGLIPK